MFPNGKRVDPQASVDAMAVVCPFGATVLTFDKLFVEMCSAERTGHLEDSRTSVGCPVSGVQLFTVKVFDRLLPDCSDLPEMPYWHFLTKVPSTTSRFGLEACPRGEPRPSTDCRWRLESVEGAERR